MIRWQYWLKRQPLPQNRDQCPGIQVTAPTRTDAAATEGSGVPGTLQRHRDQEKWILLALGILFLVALWWQREREISAKRDARDRALARAKSILAILELFIPSRMRNEEVGDAIEIINRRLADPSCRRPWLIAALLVLSTFFWVSINAVRYALAGTIRGKKAE